MLIEVPLLQRLQLLIGYPALALTLVLGALLAGGAIGSWISQSWDLSTLSARVQLSVLVIVLVGLLYWIALPLALPVLIKQGLLIRYLSAIVLVVLIGIPMGVPFPSLLRMTAHALPERVSSGLIYAVNGAFSVLGSAGAMAIAMLGGYSWSLLAGLTLYIAVFFLAGKRLSWN
jgi:hypothetical protein